MLGSWRLFVIIFMLQIWVLRKGALEFDGPWFEPLSGSETSVKSNSLPGVSASCHDPGFYVCKWEKMMQGENAWWMVKLWTCQQLFRAGRWLCVCPWHEEDLNSVLCWAPSLYVSCVSLYSPLCALCDGLMEYESLFQKEWVLLKTP